jgi:ribA/ribD-fused uncharacterized protein
MPLFPSQDDDSVYFSMTDVDTQWSREENKPFQLDDVEWSTIEHYYQAMKFDDDEYKEKIRQTESVELVKKLGKPLLKRKRSDWKAVRTTVMTRAIYTQCRTHQAMADSLIATEDLRLVENSQFDYFWGCGRDRRGDNEYGQILMNVRTKLLDELNKN